jgi:xanthine dehydrogenase accessory factor
MIVLTIIEEMERCDREAKRGILATIIHVKGSTYQKEGAKCFKAEDGKLIGLLSGGCVESDIIEHGSQVFETGIPKKIHYDFRDEGDQIWGLGVGCNGALDIFIEVYDPIAHPQKSKYMKSIFTANHSFAIATVTKAKEESRLGEKWIVKKEQEEVFAESLDRPDNVKKRKPMLAVMDHETEVFLDYIHPVPELLIFGAGPDALPLVRTVKNFGWTVKVADHRPGFITQENFPLADERIRCRQGEPPDISLHKNSYAIVMSHHFEQDQVVLDFLLQSDVRYIGVLGPSKRTKQLLKPILDHHSAQSLRLDRIYSPAGIDIGARSPEEIALSMAAELINIYRSGNGIHLKETKGQSLISEHSEEMKVHVLAT